jgi:hypothetical protein
MARKRKYRGIVIDNFIIKDKKYKVGDYYLTTNANYFKELIRINKIKQ